MRNKQVIILGLVLLLLVSLGVTTALTLHQKTGEFGEEQSESVLEEISETVRALTSPDNRYTAFIIGDKAQSLYIGTGKDFEKAKIVSTGLKDYTNLSWSPDSKLLFVGSTESNTGVILDPQDLISKFSVAGYVSGPYWEPQGDKACFTVMNLLYTDKNHYEETTDILVINLHKELQGVRFARGTLEYYYKVESWEENGKIKYSRVASRNDKVIEQLSSEFAHRLFSIDIQSREEKEIDFVKDLEYLYFNPSPDHKWLSMVKLTYSGGEAEGGIPSFYDLSTGTINDLQEEYTTWSWNPRWFSDSSRIMLNEKTVYHLPSGQLTSYVFPENIVLLGGGPSPDGTKIAVLACKYVAQTGSQGEPLTIYLVDSQSKNMQRIDTSLVPFFEDNVQSPLPVGFTWLDDQNLIVESWVQKEYSISSLWKVNTKNHSVQKYAELGRSPLVSPDGKKVLFLEEEHNEDANNLNPNTILKIALPDGTVTGSLDLQAQEYYAFAGKMFWDDSSEAVVVTAYKVVEGLERKFLIHWDITANKFSEIEIDQSANPLYSENGKIVCVDGSVY